MRNIISIGEASNALGVTPQTLRRWHDSDRLLPDVITSGGRCRSGLYRIRPDLAAMASVPQRRTVIYARVSSPGQRPDLTRQVEILQTYGASKGWTGDLLTVCSARHHGARAYANRRLLERLRTTAEAADV